MKDKIFRIAIASLEQDFEKDIKTEPVKEEKPKDKASTEEALYKGLDLVKEKKIQNLKQFNLYLQKAGIDQKDFADAITSIIKGKKLERLVQLGLFLGEGVNGSGLDLLKPSWWERNLPDEFLLKEVAPQWWKLFRDKIWLDKNKVTKD